ncbi:MAG TPA: hypothetical protein PL182_06120 [Pseudobdellovibrionaceae bacterium]|nr:hypothetical protein [Pseudobdellovibrionaceae bacterium]
MKQTNPLRALKNQLRHFGLNPDEWTMTPQGTRCCLITHRIDKELSFVGRTNLRKPRPQWQTLTLRSV